MLPSETCMTETGRSSGAECNWDADVLGAPGGARGPSPTCGRGKTHPRAPLPLTPVVSWPSLPQSCLSCFSQRFLNTFVIARHFALNFNRIHIFCPFLPFLCFQDYLRWEGFTPESRLQTLPLHPWIGQGQTRVHRLLCSIRLICYFFLFGRVSS